MIPSYSTPSASLSYVSISGLSLAPSGEDEGSDQAPGALIGRVLGQRYEILDELGHGGMGTVYRAVHVQTRRPLALKVMSKALTTLPDVVSRFKREALAASCLRSPHTVQVLDFGYDGDLAYIVMELVVGETVSAVLKRERSISEERAAAILLDVCRSLAEAHAKGIVHRDIKPDNLMIASLPDGAQIVKVVDFGLAKVPERLTAEAALSGAGLVLGTPYYMAPEQIKGEPVDGRADIYALGVLLYRLVTGELPFAGKPADVLRRQLVEHAIPPILKAPRLTRAMNTIVLRALAKEPEGRFQSVEELARALASRGRRGDEPASRGPTSGTGSARTAWTVSDSDRENPLREDGLGEGDARDAATRRWAVRPYDAEAGQALEAYERQIRCAPRLYAAITLAALALAAVSIRTWVAARQSSFDGLEQEPNDSASGATRVPFGETVQGYIGRRATEDSGDQDVYAIDVPTDVSSVSLTLTGIPNLPLCVAIYRQAEAEPIARYCTLDSTTRDVVIPAVPIGSGLHRVAVFQDRRGGDWVKENVSDAYALTVRAADDYPIAFDRASSVRSAHERTDPRRSDR